MNPTNLNGELTVMQWLATLGVGGVIAALIFMFYRKDVKQYTDLWKTTADQLIVIVKENTESNTKLVSLIEHVAERLDNLPPGNFGGGQIEEMKSRMDNIEKMLKTRAQGAGR